MEVRHDPGQRCGECGLECEFAVKYSNARSPLCGGCVAQALGVLHRAREDAKKPKPVAARMEGVRSVVRDLHDLQEIPRGGPEPHEPLKGPTGVYCQCPDCRAAVQRFVREHH